MNSDRTYAFSGSNISELHGPYLKTFHSLTVSSIGRGHARSVSHGGSDTYNASNQPLKSSLKGHQRAFSHGQIVQSYGAPTSHGHSRVGSKTDFILHPVYKKERDACIYAFSSASSAGGHRHSRQASRSESIYTLRRSEAPPWWKRIGIRPTKKLEDGIYRIVVPTHAISQKAIKINHPYNIFGTNKIRTAKYTLLSFIPKNLLEQFHRVANLYFIFIVLLNWFPAINAFGKEVAMIPVFFVLGVTAVKDLFEDRRRWLSDRRINNTACKIYNGEIDTYQKSKWQDLKVGDIVHLSNNETVPADILLLRTSDFQGVCSIDTCDLDGESNLKRRQVIHGFIEKQSYFVPKKFVSRVEVNAPTTKLYRFHGAVVHATGERIPISKENLLLRESRLKNTDFIEGIVIYAGHETKAMLNNSGPRYKRSQVEQQMNIDVIWCVVILIVLCLIGATCCKIWLSSFKHFTVPYLPFDIDPYYEGLLTFWTFIIILQVMIPLSLYVTIEFCKILQIFHIHNDIELFDCDTCKKAECRAMNITEELGQIQHIFSDKTGTLTENKMLFRRCVVNGQDYNHPASYLEDTYPECDALFPPLVTNYRLLEDMSQLISSDQCYSQEAMRIQEFLLVLAICNTVVVSTTSHSAIMNQTGIVNIEIVDVAQCGSNPTNVGKKCISKVLPLPSGDASHHCTRYMDVHPSSTSVSPAHFPSALRSQSHIPSLSPISSSEESTSSSQDPSLELKSTSSGKAKSVVNTKITTTVASIDALTEAEILTNKLENANKRPFYEAESPDELALVNAAYSYNCCLLNRSPSRLVVSAFGDRISEYDVLKVLPFDSNRKCMSIVVRCNSSKEVVLYTKGADTTILSALTPCSSTSTEGLLREKTQQYLDQYSREGLRILVMAKRNLDSAEYTDWWARHQEIESCLESRERRLRESFAKLECNLTLLGATGIEDKLQEGVPDAILSLLAAGITIWILTGDKPETAINIAYSAKLFSHKMELIRLTARSRDVAESAIGFYLSEISSVHEGDAPLKQHALVVDGKTLTIILDLRSNLIQPFLKLAKSCASVLCCRSTPLQKAYLVKIVKEELRLRTLAIGDGANDVSMIQMADIGIGISGQEGMQAVMAADFALSRFHYLKRLLLVHGFWCYDRLSRMILYFFYKSATFVFLLFWYQLYCGFSGSVMIDQMYLMLYNFIFTSLPPLIIGVYDRKVPEDLLLKNSYMYKYGRLNEAYHPHDFWIVLLDAFYQSLVVFFMALRAYIGSDAGIWEFGTTIMVSCLYTNLVYGAIEIRSWTVLHVLSIVISLSSFYIFSVIYNATCVSCFGLSSTYWVIFRCFASAVHWLAIVISTVVAVLPKLLLMTIRTHLYCNNSAVLIQNKKGRRDEDLLVAWSRSTSASSICRMTECGYKKQMITSIT